MESWFLAAVRGGAGNEKMIAEDPVRKLCLGKLRNIPAMLVCVLTVIIQAFLLNNHLARTQDTKSWIWFAGDGLVVVFFIATFFIREWRLDKLMSRHKESSGFVKGLPLGSLAWLLYAVLISARVAVIFKLDLDDGEEIGDLKITISVSAIVCVLFTVAHHHNHESLARRAAIIGLVKTFTIDLLDTVDILDVLFDTAKENPETFPRALEDYILFIVTLNLIRPAFVLASLFVDHFATVRKSLAVKIIKSILELLLVNVPLLVTRVYIAYVYKDSVSVFLVKNILGITFGVIEIYDCSYDYREATLNKSFITASQSELDSMKKISEGNGDTKKSGIDNAGSDEAVDSNDVALQKDTDGNLSI